MIVSSALSLADSEGIEAVTIRRVAVDHGVTPMALYWHFKDKDVLLDGLVERVLNEIRLPVYPEGEPPAWDVRLRDCFQAVLDGLGRHPEVADLVHQRFLGCTGGLDLAEFAFAALREAGFGQAEMSWIGVQALHNLVVLVTQEPGEKPWKRSSEDAARLVREKRASLQALLPERYPNVVLCAPELVVESAGGDAGYRALGLDILIDGIRAQAAKL